MTRNDAFISNGTDTWKHNDLGQPVVCLLTYVCLLIWIIFYYIFRKCLWHGVCYKYYLQSGHIDFELLYSNCVNYCALCTYFHSYKTKIQRYLQIWCLHCFWNKIFRSAIKRKYRQPTRETWCVLTRFLFFYNYFLF